MTQKKDKKEKNYPPKMTTKIHLLRKIKQSKREYLKNYETQEKQR